MLQGMTLKSLLKITGGLVGGIFVFFTLLSMFS